MIDAMQEMSELLESIGAMVGGRSQIQFESIVDPMSPPWARGFI